MTLDSLTFRIATLSVAALALAACGTEAPEPPAPAAPAPVPAAPASTDVPTPPETPETEVADAAATTDAAETTEAPVADDEDHGHEDGDHSHDHGEEDGHMHAGGEAHVHGEAEGAIILEGDTLTVSLDGALASFGMSEAPVETAEDEAARQAALDAFKDDAAVLAINNEAGCTLTEVSQSVRAVGGAANATFDYTYACASIGALAEVTFTIFEGTPSMEKIDLAILSGDTQDAVTLTPDAPTATISSD